MQNSCCMIPPFFIRKRDFVDRLPIKARPEGIEIKKPYETKDAHASHAPQPGPRERLSLSWRRATGTFWKRVFRLLRR